ncbi:hypothetical protein [Roseateles sp.]|uniref:hypothetical protein n=1 Tax=Roseateles sp. TaxID=1971397 RepID=UPI0031D61748
MKARITQLKAPWPSGAVVGQVVHFEAGSVPAWAVGKCEPAGEDAQADHVVAVPGDHLTLPEINGSQRQQIEEAFEALRESAQRRIEEVERAADLLAQENVQLRDRLAASDQLVADLQAKLSAGSTGGDDVTKQADAERAQLEARAKLETEARELGIQFHPNIGDAKLAEKIAEKKGEAK